LAFYCQRRNGSLTALRLLDVDNLNETIAVVMRLIKYGRVKKFRILGFFTEFSSIFFFLHLLMDIFPFVFCHPLEPVDPCFNDSYDGFLSDFVENVGHRAFQALPVRDIVFGEFLLDVTKEEEVIWCEVRAGNRVRSPLDLFV
jgi:hypothetical protein